MIDRSNNLDSVKKGQNVWPLVLGSSQILFLVRPLLPIGLVRSTSTIALSTKGGNYEEDVWLLKGHKIWYKWVEVKNGFERACVFWYLNFYNPRQEIQSMLVGIWNLS